MARFDSVVDIMDCLLDIFGSAFEVMDSLKDACKYFGHAMSKPASWCRSLAEDDPTYVGEAVWSSAQVDPDTHTVKWHDWSYEALRIYRPYTVLRVERESAKYDNKERQTLSFLDLPGEIRTRIYKMALVFESIETQTWFSPPNHMVSCAKFTRSDRIWCPYHYKVWQDTVRPTLGLLRVNKQINAEAASVFYGQNEFRFTSRSGRDVLEAFCRTIGEANTMRLAKITHHITFDNHVNRRPCMENPTRTKLTRIAESCWQRVPVWMCKSHTGVRKISQERWDNLPVWLRWKGMHMHGTKTQSQDIDFARTLVESRGGLREYKLVLPHHWQIRPKHIERHLRCVFDHVVDPHGATSGIKITLVLLDLHYGTLHRTISEMNLALRRKYLLCCECV